MDVVFAVLPGRVAQVVSTWGTRIRGIFRDSIAEVCPGFLSLGASNWATNHDDQIRVPHVLKNMAHPAKLPVAPLRAHPPEPMFSELMSMRYRKSLRSPSGTSRLEQNTTVRPSGETAG